MDKVALIQNMRFPDWWWWIGVVVIGSYLSTSKISSQFIPVIFGFSLVMASVYSLNNSFDYEGDKLNPLKRNPVARGKLSFKESIIETMLLAIIGAVLLAIVSVRGLFWVILLSILNIIYHIPPIRVKARPFYDVVCIVSIYSTPFIIGFSAFSPVTLQAISLALFFGLFSGISHPLQTAKDIEKDKKVGDVTISVKVGLRNSIVFSLILLVVTLLYFEILVFKNIISNQLFIVPAIFIIAFFSIINTFNNPTDKNLMKTWNTIRICCIIMGLIVFYILYVKKLFI